jgi:prolyl-tRNA synthetase
LEEAQKMLDVYADFAENVLAIPVLKGVKTPTERFAGALETFCIEAMMQDGKALQAGTSHFLGQNFAKAFDVKSLNKEGKQETVWATSWGVSTRLMGALIMTHSDDSGLVLPPKLAPLHVVIVPIFKKEEEANQIYEKLLPVINALKAKGLEVKFDGEDNQKPGWKFHQYELQGVPVRLAMGARDMANNTVEVFRRDTMEKQTVSLDGVTDLIISLMDEIQKNIYQKALKYREEHTYKVDRYDEFKAALDKGGFVYAPWDGTAETEERIKEETKATIRCIPLGNPLEDGVDMLTGKPSKQRVVFARAY